MSTALIDTLRLVAQSLQIPTVIILLLLILLSLVMLGSFAVEAFVERRVLKVSIPELVDSLHGKSIKEVQRIIDDSGLLPRQKKAYQEVVKRTALPDDLREALAKQMAADEEYRYRRIVKITDLIARIAPMFGLMGTLIPLGPGLIALGQGDTKTLSDSLMIAFDTTIAGLVSGAISYFISGIRKGWYEQYMSWSQTILETILTVQQAERKKIYRQLQQQKKQQEIAQMNVQTATVQNPQAGAQTVQQWSMPENLQADPQTGAVQQNPWTGEEPIL